MSLRMREALGLLETDPLFLADSLEAYTYRNDRSYRFNYYAVAATLARAYQWKGGPIIWRRLWSMPESDRGKEIFLGTLYFYHFVECLRKGFVVRFRTVIPFECARYGRYYRALF